MADHNLVASVPFALPDLDGEMVGSFWAALELNRPSSGKLSVTPFSTPFSRSDTFSRSCSQMREASVSARPARGFFMVQQFPGPEDAFFCRQREQVYLEDRLQSAGLTVVRGRPRDGKSWLIGHVLRGAAGDGPKTLIGLTRCSRQDNDNFLRACDDLYLRWLTNAPLLDQAKRLFEKYKHRWLPMVADAVGGILAATQAAGPASAVVSTALHKFSHDANLGPSFHVPRLKYDEGREFVNALKTISGANRVILALDAWEQSADIEYEAEHLQEFVRNPEAWEGTHFLVTIRNGSAADDSLQRVCTGVRPRAQIYDIPRLDIDADSEEKQRLTTFLRKVVPACREIDCADDFLVLIDGYPGVIDNWTRFGEPSRLRTLDNLRNAAAEAQHGRYPEFDRNVPTLDDATRKLCIRLALLPRWSDSTWQTLRSVFMDGITASSLDRLRADGLLEETAPPTFGHDSRIEYLIDWLATHRNNESREVCTELIFALARKIRESAPDAPLSALALGALAKPAELIRVGDCGRGLCEAARSFSGNLILGEVLVQGSRQLRNQLDMNVAPVVAMGLFNALEYANIRKDISARDALLDELRSLQQCYSDSGEVRECMARALYNGTSHAALVGDTARQNELLDELDVLQQNYPKDDDVRRCFASGLFNRLKRANIDASIDPRDANIQKLRLLAQEFPEDCHVRGAFASALGDTVVTYQTEAQLRNDLITELRVLRDCHNDNLVVSQELVRALSTEVVRWRLHSETGYDKHALLEEVRAIQRENSADATIRGLFAYAVLHSVIEASMWHDTVRRDALRAELCALHEAHPDDEKVRQFWEQRYPPP